MLSLPIDASLPAIVEALRGSRSLVLVAPPGAGKTTRVPPAILRAGLLSAAHPNLVMLQPRRVAARAAATRIAEEQDWQIGREVGYHVRFEKRMARDTRLRVLTEGILTRQLLDDPFLDGVGAVLLDEFHERSIHTDLCAALLREVQTSVRDDLIVVVMSATLEAEPVAKFFGDCPIVRSEGRVHPVEITHAGWSQERIAERAADEVREVVMSSAGEGEAPAEPPSANDVNPTTHRQPHGGSDEASPAYAGHILVFLPGAEEIRRTISNLSSLLSREDLLLLPLHGSLPFEEQVAALRPSQQRKVICATNIAETSLTIDGVRTVIDSGFARIASYDPSRGLDRLDLERISKASATQRAGRAGRQAPGRCIRLWSASQEQAMPDFTPPEIRRVDLAGTLLMLHAWGKPDPRRFGWYEPPPDDTIAVAERLLAMLGALTAERNGQITPLGRRMVELPVHPRLARLLLAAGEQGLADEGAALAALLSEKDIAVEDRSQPPWARHAKTQGDSDLLIRLDLLERAEQARFATHLWDDGIDANVARQVARTRDDLARLGAAPRLHGKSTSREDRSPSPLYSGERAGVRGRRGEDRSEVAQDRAAEAANVRAASKSPVPQSTGDREQGLLRLALLAYPDRVCRRRGNDPAAAVMVGGGGVRLAAESIVRQHEFFIAIDARADARSATREALVRIASAIDPQWLEELFPQQVTRERTLVYDEARERVVARGRTMYLDLPLREDKDAPVDPQQAGPVLAAALAPRAKELFARDERTDALLARIDLLRRHMPEHPWPALDDAGLAEMLAEACAGKRSLNEITRPGVLGDAIRSRLAYPLDRLLDQHAPESLEVPSGSHIRVEYPFGQMPVLAVRLQEIFGWTDTPRLAAGRAPVVLHLLGPNFRPVQVTADLRSFWTGTYFQVRKDLRVRYPRHAWPEDPLTAKPEAKGGRRRG